MTEAEVMKELEDYLLHEGFKHRGKRYSKITIQIYQLAVKRLLDFTKKDAKDITYKDIDKWREHLDEYTSNKTGKIYYQNSKINMIAGINLFCKLYKVKDEDGQYYHLKAPTQIPPEKPRIPLSDDETQRLYNAVKHDIEYYAIFRTMLEAGVRISELINLNLDSIKQREINNEIVYYISVGNRDFSPKDEGYKIPVISKETYDAIQEYLKIRVPKCDEEKAKKLTERRELLKRQLKEAEDKGDNKARKSAYVQLHNTEWLYNRAIDSQRALFLNIHGERIGGSSLRDSIKEYCAIAKIERKVIPHEFRHSMISKWTREGKSTGQIKFQSGHKRSDNLDKYSHDDLEARAKDFKDVYKPQLEVKKEIKPMTKPEIPDIPKEVQEIQEKKLELHIKQLELELANRNAEIKLLELKSKLKKPDDDNKNMFG